MAVSTAGSTFPINYAESQVSRVIPGHGPVTADWPKAMDDQLRYLSTLRTDIRSLIHSGKYLEDALKFRGSIGKKPVVAF